MTAGRPPLQSVSGSGSARPLDGLSTEALRDQYRCNARLYEATYSRAEAADDLVSVWPTLGAILSAQLKIRSELDRRETAPWIA